MIKAIIFDMDGVLIDSEPVYAKNQIKCLNHFGIKVTEEDLIPLAGGTKIHYDQVLNPLLQGIVEREKYDHYLNDYYKKHPVDYKAILNPGVHELLQYLKNKDYRIIVASSSARWEIENVFNLCNLNSYFEFIMSGDMFKASKPNPEIYLKSVENLGLTSDECIAIEDSEYGITAAKRAGLTCIGLEDLRYRYDQSQADYLIKKLIDIKDILEEIKNEKN